MIYCVEVDRSGLCEENVTFHLNLKKEPTRDEIVKAVEDEDIGFSEEWCRIEYYKVG